MKQNSNLILAVLFLVGFFLVWDKLVMSKYTVRPPMKSATSTGVAGPSGSGGVPNDVGLPSVGEVKDTTTVLKSEGTEVVFDSHGAAATSWKLKERDHWMEMVLPVKERSHSPLETFPDLNFKVLRKSDHEAVFAARLPNGVVVEKTISLLGQPPFHLLSLRFSNPGKSEQTVSAEMGWGDGLAKIHLGDEKSEKALMTEMRAAGLVGDLVRTWRPGLIFNREINPDQAGPFKWIGVDNHHFIAAFMGIHDNIPQAKVVAERKKAPYVAIPYNISLKPGESQTFEYRLYVGPKAYSALLKMDGELWRAVNFGKFGFIAKLLLRSLMFFRSFTGNYGWAIVMLTLCIQAVVFPLTRKSLQHSVKMKEIQPHLKKIQEQFKSDPKRLQVETMNFYRKNGMKLMGMEGCVPVLFQIPVFIAFYATLNAAYELRGAPWIFWIHDLGIHDPLYILPVIMGLGMFVQQRFSAATAADPAQAKMMMFMPVMMTFMFMKLPAGLVLYWCVNSLTTIVIQRVMMKNMTRHQAVV